jgi:hypothetical protein
MTQDEIIDMAKQAGIEEAYSLKHNQYLVRFKDGSLEVFAKLVAEAEREACAQIVNDDRGLSDDDAIRVCRTIRARGTNMMPPPSKELCLMMAKINYPRDEKLSWTWLFAWGFHDAYVEGWYEGVKL